MESTKPPSVKEDRTSIAYSIRKTDRNNAIITGSLFIAAAVSAIIGLNLYAPLSNMPDYLPQRSAHYNQIVLGTVFEMILLLSACGTAIMLYPYLKAFNERLALGYLSFRLIEALIILSGIISILSMLSVSQSFNPGNGINTGMHGTITMFLKSFQHWTFNLGPKFMLGINTLFLSYVFYKTVLIPKSLAVLGLAGAALILINSLLKMFGPITSLSAMDILLGFPIAIYEMILAGWLIIKGFSIHYYTPNK